MVSRPPTTSALAWSSAFIAAPLAVTSAELSVTQRGHDDASETRSSEARMPRHTRHS